LQDAGERADLVDRIRIRIIVGSVLLRRQQDQRVVLHDLFERPDRFLAADEQRHDHVRENDDIAERQHRIGVAFAVNDRWPGFGSGHGLFLLLCPLARQSASRAQPPQGALSIRMVQPRRDLRPVKTCDESCKNIRRRLH
jgi:hypothetical protein